MEKISELFLKIYPIEGVPIPIKRRILLHSIFWLMLFVGVWKALMLPITGLMYNFITTLYFVTLDIVYFYSITYLIIPFWDNDYQHKYLATTIGMTILIASTVFFYHIRVQFIFDNNLLRNTNMDIKYLKSIYTDYEYLFKSGYFIKSILEIFLTALPAFFIKLTRSLVKNISEKKQIEIDYLRSQINPHFLTNTLNNIYSLSVTDDKRNSDAILSLSSLLDYVLYESNQPTISLEKEINFLSNFIELEKIRNTKKLQVNFEIEGDIHGNIPPMILITFVENAFKHSIGDSNMMCLISIYIKVTNSNLYFEVKNTKPSRKVNYSKKTFGGIGLNNVQKRLSTLYTNKHSLQIKNDEYLYTIRMSLDLM